MKIVSQKPQSPEILFLRMMLVLSLGMLSCANSDTNDNTPPIEQSNASVKLSPHESITTKLTSYYADLSSGVIEVDQYYAPEVERFFNSQHISREKIGISLAQSLKNNPNRQLELIGETVETGQKGKQLWAKIEGIATVRNDEGQITSRDTFRNRIGFNDQMQIISYESIAPIEIQSRKLGIRYAEKESLISDLLQGLKSGKVSALKDCIHPKLGAYFAYKPGSIPSVANIKSIDEIQEILPMGPPIWPDIVLQSQAKEIPSFDCENEFSDKGTFYAHIAEDFRELSEIMQLNNDFAKAYDEKELEKAHRIEQLISWEVLNTQSYLTLYIGKLDGRWYLWMIDIARYDCSA